MFRKKPTAYETLYGDSVKDETVSIPTENETDSGIEEAAPVKEKKLSKKAKPKKEKSRNGKKRDWAVIMRSKKTIGIILVVIALIMIIVVEPTIRYFNNEKMVTVITAVSDIAVNTKITEDMISQSLVSQSSALKGMQLKADEVIGQYLNVPKTAGEPIYKTNIITDGSNENDFLNTLPDGKLAITVTLQTAASSLASSIKSDDIVTVYAYVAPKAQDEKEISLQAQQPQELKYVKVLKITGSKANTITSTSQAPATATTEVETVTLLVNSEQAQILAGLEKIAPVHLGLVCRGNEEKAQQLLQLQDEALAQLIASKAETVVTDNE